MSTVSHPADGVTLHHGDALAVLRAMDVASIDAVVTDPPYALAFMGRAWDTQPSPQAFQAWCEQWAAECLRVVKPGGYLASFGGTRTYHRLTSGIEDAGWHITDSIGAGLYAWTHGQGFPKGKSQLKPAWEPITVARKPAKRVEPLQIDAARVGHELRMNVPAGSLGNGATMDGGKAQEGRDVTTVSGRYPTNLVLAHHPECVEVGTREVATGVAVQRNRSGVKPASVYGAYGTTTDDQTYGTDGRETIPAFDCHPDCHVAALDEQSGERPSGGSGHERSTARADTFGQFTPGRNVARGADSGGASRFFPTFRYQAKAPRSERPQVDGQGWPTVKPQGLMRWLVRLLAPPGAVVLDPFAGSGSTLQAARDEGFTAVGIDADDMAILLTHQRFADAAPRDLDLFVTNVS